MDLLLSFFILIISTIIGIIIGLFLNIESYILISFIVILLFIGIKYLNKYMILESKKQKLNTSPYTTNGIQTTISNVTDYNPTKDNSNGKFAKQKELEDTKYSIFKKKDESGNDKNSLPLDGLSPKDLLTSLNYITYSTANPYKPISYHNYKTHADKYLNDDGTKLSTNDIKLQEFTKAHYPQLTENQIDARDCLNFGSGKDSCFQSAQLFNNIKEDYGILNNGVNVDNSNLIIKEDFTNPMILNTDNRYQPILFKNAPNGNLDRILDGESNERINLDISTDLCRNCKTAKCPDDYCSLQNQLFM